MRSKIPASRSPHWRGGAPPGYHHHVLGLDHDHANLEESDKFDNNLKCQSFSISIRFFPQPYLSAQPFTLRARLVRVLQVLVRLSLPRRRLGAFHLEWFHLFQNLIEKIFLSSCLPLDPAVQLDVLAVVVDVVAPGDRHGHDGNGDLIKVRMTMIMTMM